MLMVAPNPASSGGALPTGAGRGRRSKNQGKRVLRRNKHGKGAAKKTKTRVKNELLEGDRLLFRRGFTKLVKNLEKPQNADKRQRVGRQSRYQTWGKVKLVQKERAIVHNSKFPKAKDLHTTTKRKVPRE